ncbi:MAG: hypothetical protein RMI01_09900, partial [Thermodesulfovibrio sp.]|nr:hypothetical protein [Thermodesulfovibrio sp.]
MPPFIKDYFIQSSPQKILLLTLAFIFLFIMHIFFPNIGGVIAKQVDYVIWLASGFLVFIGCLNVLNK